MAARRPHRTGGAPTTPSSDIQSLLLLVRTHQRSHDDGAYDASSVQRCRAMLNKLKKVLPKLLRLISTVSVDEATDMLRDMCELLQLLIHERVCPHATAVFVDEARSASDESATTHQGTGTQSFPTIATILLYLMSFYCSERLVDVQAVVLDVVVQLVVLLQSRDTYASLHFFQDSVELLEDCLLVEECMRRTDGDSESGAASVACFLNTAIHAFHGSEGPLGSDSITILCGCVAVEDAAAVRHRKAQLKALLPALHISSYSASVVLRKSIELLATELLKVTGPQVMLSQGSKRLSLLMGSLLDRDVEMVTKIAQVSVVNGASSRDKLDVAEATCELLSALLSIHSQSERSFIQVCDAFFRRTSCYFGVEELACVVQRVLRQISTSLPRLSSFSREELFPVMISWHNQIFLLLSSTSVVVAHASLFTTTLRLYESMMTEFSGSSVLAMVELLRAGGDVALNEDVQVAGIKIIHEYISVQQRLSQFLRAVSRGLTELQHQPVQNAEHVSSKRRRKNICSLNGTALSHRDLHRSCEELSSYILDLIFVRRSDARSEFQWVIFALRILLPLRSLADRVSRAVSQSIIRAVIQRVEELLRSAQVAHDGVESFDLIVILLTHLNDQEVGRFRAFVEGALSSTGLDPMLREESRASVHASDTLFKLANDYQALRVAPSEWLPKKISVWLSKCDGFTNQLMRMSPLSRRLFLIVVVWKHHRAFNLRIGGWKETTAGQLAEQLCRRSNPTTTRLSMVSILPMILVVVDKDHMDAESFGRLIRSLLGLLTSICTSSNEDPKVVTASLNGFQAILCMSVLHDCTNKDFEAWISKPASCCPSSTKISARPTEDTTAIHQALLPVLAWFGTKKMVEKFPLPMLNIAASVLRHANLVESDAAPPMILDIVFSLITDGDRQIRRVAIRHFRAYVDLPVFAAFLVDAERSSTASTAMERLDCAIAQAMKDRDFLLLETCIEAIGSICMSKPIVDGDLREVLIWGLLQLLFLWINTHGAQGPVSTAVHDQIRKVFVCHRISWKTLFAAYPEDLYFPVVNSLLRTKSLQAFTCTFFGDHFDEAILLRDSAAHVLPNYVLNRQNDMMRCFVDAYNGDAPDGDVEMDEELLEHYPSATMSMSALLLDNIAYVLKELIIHQVEAANNENRIKEWEFLFKYLPENTTIRDVITHSPLRLLKLLAWELGGERSGLAKKAFREISQYLSQRKDAPEGDIDAALVMPRQFFLALMTDLGYKITKRGPMTSSIHRTRAIRSMHRLFGIFNHPDDDNEEAVEGALDPFVPKVMAILKVGLNEKQLQEPAILAWSAFVRMLTAKALESNLVSIVVSVLPCIGANGQALDTDGDMGDSKSRCLKALDHPDDELGRAVDGKATPSETSESAAVGILQYLFVEKRLELKQAFPRVRLLPAIPALDEVYAAYVAEAGDPSRRTLIDFLKNCLPYVTHWDSGVREIVLRELNHMLGARVMELRQLLQSEGNFVDPTVLKILFAILDVARTDTAEGIRLLCAKCLGSLGAVDGARIPLSVLHSSNHGANNSKDRSDSRLEYSTKDLTCVLVENWLVKELRAAPENTDAVAFSIQELLKFLADLSADPQHSGQKLEGGLANGGRRAKGQSGPPLPEWIKRRFERKDVLEFVEPYWYTNYSVTNKRKMRFDSSVSFYEKYSSTYEEWLHSWCRRLVDLSQPPERKIFQACEMVLSTSAQIARFLLPYLVQNVLRSGRPEIYEEVKREIMAVLKDDGVMDEQARTISMEPLSRSDRADDPNERAFGEYASRHHQCVQTIVSTIDELNEWVWSNEKKRLALSAPASRSTAPTPARPGDIPSDLDDQEKENLEEFLKDIPSQALSNAAFKIKAYARALQYFEVYLRQQPPPVKKETNNTSSLLTMLPVDLPLVSRHAAYLQQLYSRVDEPDALTGLATLRRLYDAQRHTESAPDRKGEEVEEAASSLTYLLHQVVDHEQLAQWEDALACYEQAMQEVHSAEASHGFYSVEMHEAEDDVQHGQLVGPGIGRDPRAVKPALYSGIVHCLIQLGRLESALQHINGIVTQEPQFVGTLYPHALECAWRLSRWDLVSELLNTEQQTSLLSNSLVQGGVSSRLRNLEVSQLSLVRVLHSLHEGNPTAFSKSLHEARLEIMGPLAAACAESYQRAYPLLHKLHFLHEAEQGFISIHASRDEDLSAREKRWNEQCAWDARYELLSASLRFRDPILALRRVMLHEADLRSQVSHNWLSYAKIARKEGFIRTANSAVMHAEALDNPYASLEKAKLMVAQDRMYEALQILEPVDIDASKLDFLVEDPHYCAKNLLLATNWMQESGQRQGKKVVERYEAVIKFDPEWEKGYFYLAKYYEYLLSVSHPEAPTAISATSSTRNDDAAVNIDSTFHSHLINLMKNYVLALSHGTKHVFQSLPRLLTLWFEYGELLQPGSNKGTSVNKAMRSIEIELSQTSIEQQILTDITQTMQNATDMLPAYEWLVCFPQVTSRICHPNPIVVDGVKKILIKVLATYPTQAMWPLLGLSRSLNLQRRNRARDIISATQRHFVNCGEQEIANSFSEGMRLVEELITLAGHDPGNLRKVHIKLSRIRTQILVPVQAGLNTVLPLSGLAPGEDRHVAFMPHSQVYIKAFSDKADVMMTKEKPKRIEVLGTDGQLYPFLCKREKTGDLRKDARMMEFNMMINKLLQKDREGRKRKLRLRTYAVVCLNEESGLMEWVRHTKAMRQLIGQIHKTERGFIQPVRLTHEIKERFLGMQKKYANNITMMALCFRHKILGLPVFTPRFHQWFTNNFTDPTTWFEARLAFSRSAAVWSMVGHIIGLGDRHGENILIDTTNGECVHVDFDCLFDKGLKLAKPEIVPFRLTPNIIDAFGITGYEGVFRRVCEVTMELLRDNKETLRSVLESFIHDPLVEWGRRGKNAQGMAASSNGRNIADISSDRSKEETRIILKTIDDRLRGIYNLGDAIRPLVSSAHRSLLPENETLPLSVQGQVDKLIHEATSHENLAQMYIGWMPFL